MSWDITWRAMSAHIETIPGKDPRSMFDYLVVGGGFAGAVAAERLAAAAGKKVLIVDKRNHIGGNAYDHYDELTQWTAANGC